METFLTPEGIIVATVAAFLVGSLYYSPLVFLDVWLRVNGLTRATAPKRSKPYMISISLYSFVAHGAMAAVLALIFDIVQVTLLTTALSVGGLLALGFIVTTRYIDMLYTVEETHYSKKQQIKFLLNSGYYVLTVLSMSLVLFCNTLR